MNNSGIFNLNRTAMLAGIISASFSLHAMASAGKVEFALGGANLLRNDGSSQQVSKGDEINPGDTIKTTNGRVQVRFTDGGYMSLQPNTEFKVEDYSYSGKTDGTEKAFFRLIEGGLRAITGVVGHANKPNYKVSTPVATIGIRGSEYLAEFRGTLRAHCNHGSIYVFNDKGNLILFRGQTAVVGNGAPSYGDNTEGVGARGPSNTNTANNEQSKDQNKDTTFRAGDVVNEDGTHASIVNDGNLALAYVAQGQYGSDPQVGFNGTFSDGEGGSYTDSYSLNIDSAGNFLGGKGSSLYTDGYYTSSVTFTDTAHGATLDPGSNGALRWFRVSGYVDEAYTDTYSYGGGEPSINSGVETYYNPHYIYGSLTSAADIASLSGYQITYSLVGGTNPVDTYTTYCSGTLVSVGVLNSAVMTANFGAQTVSGNINATVSANTYDYNFGGNISTLANGATFSGYGYASGSIAVAGFFAGAKAAQVGLSYTINENNHQITGVAALNQTGQTAPATPAVTPQ